MSVLLKISWKDKASNTEVSNEFGQKGCNFVGKLHNSNSPFQAFIQLLQSHFIV